MASLLRNVAAVMGGLSIGSCVNMAIISLNSYYLYPMPSGVTLDDQEGFAIYIQSLPIGAYFVVFAAHLGQSVIGGYVAAKLGGSRPVLHSHIVGGATLLGSVMTNLQLHVPAWTWMELPLHPILAHLVGTFVEQSKQKTKAP